MGSSSVAVLLSVVLAAPPDIEFNRDVRGILSDHCFQCHGPDKAKRKADLRLDTETGLRSALVPGKPLDSELFKRLIADDPAERMPPRSGRPLSPTQIDTLKRWIAQGAPWQKHWAFLPPRRPPLPTIRTPHSAIRNPLDTFIVAALEPAGLTLSAEAERTTLLRRVTLDLTGLPPTPQEVEAALADRSPDWYEKVVERLLASPRFGERLAIDWLDAARYADSSGYQSDGERFMWRWRDWVLDAFNANMPFDQFTVEQLAGDLLPQPTLEQRIATGFNRNHRGNAEGGIVPEEYAVEYVVDRVDTTMAVWQGLTMGCARCHDHKFDPFSAKEYYQLFAYFNNVPEHGRAIKYGNSPPLIKAPTRLQQQQLRDLDDRLAAARAAFADNRKQLQREQQRWEKSLKTPLDWTPTGSQEAHFALDGETKDLAGKTVFATGRLGRALDLDGKGHLDAGEVGGFGFYDKFTLAVWVQPRGQDGAILAKVNESPRGDGYALRLERGKVQLTLTKRWLDDALRVETDQPIDTGRWTHLVATYDGSRLASGVRLYLDGKPAKLKVLLDELNQTFENTAPLRIGASGGGADNFKGLVDEVRVYSRCLSADEAAVVATLEPLHVLAALPAAKRSPAQAVKLRSAFLALGASDSVRKLQREVVELEEERASLLEKVPTTMVMEELPKPRPAHLLLRGQYDKRGEAVSPGIPAVLSSTQPRTTTRLDLARWLVSADNPLTARVMVNRYWQHYFGVGLVKTPEDFGSQGEPPSHPELLDWLAVEFRASGWDVKRLHRLLVTSAVYRQSSQVTALHLQRDPANRLLARAPRLRLPAELVRDQALFAAGLLRERVGGPSVKTYHPVGLWEELSGVAYQMDKGEALYRRSLYTFWKRTVTPPAMATFDATAREACMVNRARTNTPLQALALLNDVPYVESARVLAERVLRAAMTDDERIKLAFLSLTGRSPHGNEMAILKAGLLRHREHYRKDVEAADKLAAIGKSPRYGELKIHDVAAYTALTGIILNLDEVITRE